ncbi:MAG: hypothetical protein NTX96_01525 [Candidatus Zambryskibacteria bacterium]|nr:hypothetical protein [Candidatus Zambryskibacteria bacterium]
MFNISLFLEKFSKNIQSVEIYKKQILDIIEKYTQIKISPKEIEIKNYIIYLKTSPAILNKIFIYKNKILEEIIQSIPNLKIVDIR